MDLEVQRPKGNPRSPEPKPLFTGNRRSGKKRLSSAHTAAARNVGSKQSKDEALHPTWPHPCTTPPPAASVHKNCYCQMPPSPTSIHPFFLKPEHCAEVGAGQRVGRSVTVKFKVLERRSLWAASSLQARQPGYWYSVPRCAFSPAASLPSQA